MNRKLVIVGAGMATALLLNELYRRPHDLDVTVFSEEADLCYNRVLLSNLLAGEAEVDELAMLEAPVLSQVRFCAGESVSRIDMASQSLVTAGGSTERYDQLVLATGSSVAESGIESSIGKGVHQFRSLSDARGLFALDRTGRRVVVIGGGLLGLEAAHGMNELGFDVSVVHRRSMLMNRQLDAEGATQLKDTLEAKGLKFHLGRTPKSLEHRGGELVEVRLDDGTTLATDHVLLATGIAPRVEIAASAGLACDRGIRVDGAMRTSEPGIFAIGECAQLGNTCFGLIAPIRAQASTLADELLGMREASYAIEDAPTHLKISGVEIYRAGELDEAAEHLVLRDASGGIYRRLDVRGGRLIGAVLVGDKSDNHWYTELIKTRQPLGPMRDGLMFGRAVAESFLHAAAAA